MSRTDKDTPDWVRAHRDPQAREVHACAGRRTVASFWLGGRPAPEDCDLELGRLGSRTRCYRVESATRSPYRHVPRWYRHDHWYGPDRAAARTGCRMAGRDWNGSAGTDIEPPARQHRHGAAWMWE